MAGFPKLSNYMFFNNTENRLTQNSAFAAHCFENTLMICHSENSTDMAAYWELSWKGLPRQILSYIELSS